MIGCRRFFDVDEWAADAKENVDALVGFRLHGNVIGPASGNTGGVLHLRFAHSRAFNAIRDPVC